MLVGSPLLLTFLCVVVLQGDDAERLDALLARLRQPPPAAGPAGPIPGEAFTEPLTPIRLLWVPGGRFQMGSEGTSERERPVHGVRLSAFRIAETPVTNQQYGVFLKEAGDREEPAYWRDRRFSAPEQPDETRACFGLDWNEGQPAPVRSYPAGRGPFGTLDQAGNIWEWCLDVRDDKAYEKRVTRQRKRKVQLGDESLDPLVSAGDEERRVVRGGAWGHSTEVLPSGVRGGYSAGRRSDVLGFGVVVAPASD